MSLQIQIITTNTIFVRWTVVEWHEMTANGQSFVVKKEVGREGHDNVGKDNER